MIVGRWRIRRRWHLRKFLSWWFERNQYPEGTVYRGAIGFVQFTVMVDALSAAERDRLAAQAKAFREFLNESPSRAVWRDWPRRN